MAAVRHLEFSKFAIMFTCLCRCAILLPSSTLRVSWTIWHWGIAKNYFQYGGWPPFFSW